MGLTGAPLSKKRQKRLIAYHEVATPLITTLLASRRLGQGDPAGPVPEGSAALPRTTPDENILDSA